MAELNAQSHDRWTLLINVSTANIMTTYADRAGLSLTVAMSRFCGHALTRRVNREAGSRELEGPGWWRWFVPLYQLLGGLPPMKEVPYPGTVAFEAKRINLSLNVHPEVQSFIYSVMTSMGTNDVGRAVDLIVARSEPLMTMLERGRWVIARGAKQNYFNRIKPARAE